MAAWRRSATPTGCGSSSTTGAGCRRGSRPGSGTCGTTGPLGHPISGTSDLWDSTSDPATPSTARASITSWLTLTDLTDTTTIAVTTTFDAAGRPTDVTYPESLRTKATYNLAGMVEQLELDRGTGAGYEIVMQQARFNARGQPTSHLAGNGVLTTKAYDADIERLLRIFTKLPGSPDVRMQDQNYAYDPAGNPVQITDALAETSYRDNQVIPNTRTFRYDPRYRLVRATGKRHSSSAPDKTGDIAVPTPTWGDYEPYSIRYSYDEVGNFTTNQEYKSGTNNLSYKADRIDLFNGDASEATSADPTLGNYTYDADGNTLKTPRIAALVYTHDDQPVFIDMGGGGVVRYARHADQRVLRFVNKTGVKSVRVYLGAFEYERRTGATAYTKLTLHCEGSGVSCQAERVLAGSDSTSLMRLWRHRDHLGSGQILTKTDGTLLSQEEYYPYGWPSDRRDSRNRYRYIGVERDEDTGLCVTGPRTYDPVVGRFLQQDPIPTMFRVSGYCYASCSPLRRVDANGFEDGDMVQDAPDEPEYDYSKQRKTPSSTGAHPGAGSRGQDSVSVVEGGRYDKAGEWTPDKAQVISRGEFEARADRFIERVRSGTSGTLRVEEREGHPEFRTEMLAKLDMVAHDPSGYSMLRELEESETQITLGYGSKFLTKDSSHRIEGDPASTQLYRGIAAAWNNVGADVQLYHEFVHEYQKLVGQKDPKLATPDYAIYTNLFGDEIMEDARLTELLASGVDAAQLARYNENIYRQNRGLALRPFYGPPQ